MITKLIKKPIGGVSSDVKDLGEVIGPIVGVAIDGAGCQVIIPLHQVIWDLSDLGYNLSSRRSEYSRQKLYSYYYQHTQEQCMEEKLFVLGHVAVYLIQRRGSNNEQCELLNPIVSYPQRERGVVFPRRAWE